MLEPKELNWGEKGLALVGALTYAFENGGLYFIGGVNAFDLLNRWFNGTLNQSMAQQFVVHLDTNLQIEEFIILMGASLGLFSANLTSFYDFIAKFLSKQDKANWQRVTQLGLGLHKLDLSDEKQALQFELVNYFMAQCLKKTASEICLSFKAKTVIATNQGKQENNPSDKKISPFHLMIVSENKALNSLIEIYWEKSNLNFTSDNKKTWEENLSTFVSECSQQTHYDLKVVFFQCPEPMLIISDKDYVSDVAEELLSKLGVVNRGLAKAVHAGSRLKRASDPFGAEFKAFCVSSSLITAANLLIKNMELTYNTMPVLMILGLISQYAILAKDHDKRLIANNAISCLTSVLAGILGKKISDSDFYCVLTFGVAYFVDKGVAAKWDTVMARWPIEKCRQLYADYRNKQAKKLNVNDDEFKEKASGESEKPAELKLNQPLGEKLISHLEQTIWKKKKVDGSQLLMQEQKLVEIVVEKKGETKPLLASQEDSDSKHQSLTTYS